MTIAPAVALVVAASLTVGAYTYSEPPKSQPVPQCFKTQEPDPEAAERVLIVCAY